MRPETALQRKILADLRQRGFKAIHVPNGAVLSGDPKARAIQMNSLKASGLTVGFPDLIVYAPLGQVGHLEIKIEGEKLTDTQVAVQGWMVELGHKYAVCRSLADVDETLTKWGWA